jgi:poly-gamma-glutamate synthesis protein (capsule biosynthesis protein)
VTPRRRAGLAAAAACALVLAACGEDQQVSVWHPVAPTTAAPAPSPTRPAEITLAFAGDVHFTGRTLALLDDPRTAIGRFADVLREADLAMLNLETAVTQRGTPEPKTYHFRAPATAYQAIQAAGVDVISLANNHTLDYGQVGLRDTLDSVRDAGLPQVGAGRDADQANAAYLTTVGGVRLAVLGFSQVHELESTWRATGSRPGIAIASDRSAAAVREADETADLVVVYVHWGQEGNPCPTGEMREFADVMAEAGADIVLGTHAHVLLAGGWLGETYVHWGLGNFVWYGDSHSTDTGVLLVTVRDGAVAGAELLPGTVSGTGQPVLVDGADRQGLEQRLAYATGCSGLSDRPEAR